MTKKEALKEIGEGLTRVANAILSLADEENGEAEEKKEGEVEEKKEEAEKKEEVEPVKRNEEVEEPKAKKEKYTMEDVRKALAAKSGAGFTAEVRELLQRHGGSKLSAIDTAEYAAIMEEVQHIGSAQ